MTVYITSDLHFNHSKVMEQRGYTDLAKMNWDLIDFWNSKITENDDVYYLGDFCFGDIDHTLKSYKIELPNGYVSCNDLLRHLRCRTLHFVIGNHDTSSKLKIYNNYGYTDKTIRFYSCLTYKVSEFEKVLFTHYPIHPYLFNEESREGVKKLGNVHGHIHFGTVNDSRYINVNYDVCHKIYTLDEVLDYFNGDKDAGIQKN